MATHHRPLVTSAIAGGLLCALWFVPSANASHEGDEPAPRTSSSQQQSDDSEGWDTASETGEGTTEDAGVNTQSASGESPRLAETGSFDTTPYLTGGVAFLAVGSGLLAHSLRRGRVQEI